MIESEIRDDDFRNARVKVIVQDNESAEFEARLACSLLERWGLVAAEPDGEDSSGRQQLRLSTPQELVTRACEVASAAVSAFRARGWLTKLPTLSEIKAVRDNLHD